jgi:F-type H+-transporting ATPase subunit b
MSFELKQTITQILAFLVMLWVLKRYAWKPLLNLLDERTHKIQADLDLAKVKNQHADERLEEYSKRIAKIQEEGKVIIQNAAKEAGQLGQEIQENAQRKAHEIIQKAHDQCVREQENAREELKKEMIDISFVALEKLVHTKLKKEDRDRFLVEILKEI